MITIRVIVDWHNPGGPPQLPLTACAFSGCAEPFAGAHGPWRLCARHLDAIERGRRRRLIRRP